VSVTPEGERFAEQFFKQHGLAGRTVVAIHPGARQLYIRWKLDGFADVGARLSAEKGAAVVIIGSVSEVDLVAAVASSIPGAVQAVGLPVAGLVSVLKRCQLFIGNSTGPMHIASALGVPVVALFGSHHALDSPRAWQPWGLRSVVIAKDPGCRACHPGDCRDYRCMESITAGEVYHAACKLLDHADATL
jgi:heptosyltransferase-2